MRIEAIQMRRFEHESWLDPRIAVRTSAVSGRGMIAVAPIQAGEIVMKWGGGLIVTTEELKTLAIVPDSAIPIAEGLHIVTPADGGEIEDDFFINHSCDPSLWMADEVTFIARYHIPAGGEVNADYVYWQDDDTLVAAWECLCGSPLCRGRVRGDDWRRPELQERYRGYFSPFVNARIEKLLRGA
jgi:uncharacterized protein